MGIFGRLELCLDILQRLGQRALSLEQLVEPFLTGGVAITCLAVFDPCGSHFQVLSAVILVRWQVDKAVAHS